MIAGGCEQGNFNPIMYYPTSCHIWAYVQDACWFKGLLEARFEIKPSIVGHSVGLEGEARDLNRIVRATDNGREYEQT